MEFLIIIISAVFVNNILLAQFLGVCPFLGVSNKVSTAVGMSGAVCFVMTLALMAMDPRGGQVELPGEHVREPAFGLPATWVAEDLREEATFRGYTLVDPATVLTTHLTEILKEAMPDLLGYADVQKLIRDLPADQKKLADDLIPSVMPATTVVRVLQALLKERVSIRDLPGILEGIGEAAPHTTGVVALVEHVRGRLARQLCFANRADDGALPIVTLSPDWEMEFADALIGPFGTAFSHARFPGVKALCVHSAASAATGLNPCELVSPAHTRSWFPRTFTVASGCSVSITSLGLAPYPTASPRFQSWSKLPAASRTARSA